MMELWSCLKCLFCDAPRTLVLEVLLKLMYNDIMKCQLHDDGMQEMRPYKKLYLLSGQVAILLGSERRAKVDIYC